jgi:ATP-dependent protease HslVU (ClpYQ) peptidase subunit
MSVVVAIKENGKVTIGADSQCTRGGTRRTLSNPNNYKVWKVLDAENCLFAQVGLVREANIIRVARDLVPEMAQLKDKVDFSFVVKRLVPRMFEELEEYRAIKKGDTPPEFESSFLFAYKDKLFYISGNATVIEIDDYVAIGSGECEAIGSLLSTEGEACEDRIKKAIKASAASDIYVDYPIVITDTESCEFKVFYEKDLVKAKCDE